MVEPAAPQPDIDPAQIEQEAHEWVRRLASGEVRQSDVLALRAWCARSDAHSAAFAQARRTWQALGPAVAKVARDQGRPLRPAMPSLPARQPALRMTRRQMLGGMLAAAGVGTIAVLTPTPAWFDTFAGLADFSTGTGEQRELAPTMAVRVAMNTQTRLAWLPQDESDTGLRLLRGEAALDIGTGAPPFWLAAGAGRITGQDAHFEVRYLEQDVCVTCLAGTVQVAHPHGGKTLQARQSVSYTDQTLHPVVLLAEDDLPVWQQGEIRFKERPLQDVIAEINRYRAGRLMLMSRAHDDSLVTGRFDIANLDPAIAQIQRAFGLSVTRLPGGVVLLG